MRLGTERVWYEAKSYTFTAHPYDGGLFGGNGDWYHFLLLKHREGAPVEKIKHWHFLQHLETQKTLGGDK